MPENGAIMNEKEIGELRRRLRPEKNAITHICGCYINEAGEMISPFHQSLAMMTQEESEEILTILRKTMTGTLGKQLVDLTFDTQKVAYGEEHKRLMKLRDCALKDTEIVEEFLSNVASLVELEGSYLILLAYDRYDVPYRSGDGGDQADGSSDVFSYYLCAVCPVKQSKPALGYYVKENAFRTLRTDWVIAPPQVGFLFPAFDGRATNLYGALYYAKDGNNNQPQLIEGLFSCPVPMAAESQKENFTALLGTSLAEEASYEVVQAVHQQFRDIITAHKEEGEGEVLALSKGGVKGVLRSCGVGESGINTFDASYDETFGQEASLNPKNLIDPKRLEIKTTHVTIRVEPEGADLVETRVIDGKKYILINAHDGVEVNAIPVQIQEK